jgi:hypothetical protein
MALASVLDPAMFRRRDYFTGFVVVRLQPALARVEASDLAAAARDREIGALGEVLAAYGVKDCRRLVTSLRLSELLALEQRATFSEFRPLRSLASYWRLDLRHAPQRMGELVMNLLGLPAVDDAYIDIAVGLPAVTPGDEPLSSYQGHLDPAPQGIDAKFAWNLAGGDGAGIGFVDVEAGWNLAHEDLAGKTPTLIVGVNNPGFAESTHGTASLGVVVASDNGVGLIGVAPGASSVRVASVWDGSTPGHVVDAVAAAAQVMSAGDVMMLELETARGSITHWPDNHPVEIKDAEFDAIRLAVAAKNIVVVAAAGNAGANLDAYVSPQGTSIGKQVLNRASADFRDSGAIMVGAATSSLPHQRWLGASGGGSNYGSRVDCYAWGENVATCGFGFPSLGLTLDPNKSYWAGFNATSAATAIIAGAAVALQGMKKAATGATLTSQQMRALFADPTLGTPTDLSLPATIGPMPDLRRINAFLRLGPDLYLRDMVGDTGAVPSNNPVGASPDVIVLNAKVVDPAAAFTGPANENRDDLGASAVAGADAQVYLRMKNRGGGDAQGVTARVWWIEQVTAAIPLTVKWNLIGEIAGTNVPAGDVLTVAGPITWDSQDMPPAGHYCLAAALDCAQDPAPSGIEAIAHWDEFVQLVQNSNKVTWRNIDITTATLNRWISPRFLIVGAADMGRQFDFVIEQRLPGETHLALQVPAHFAGLLHARADCAVGIETRDEDDAVMVLPAQPAIRLGHVLMPRAARFPARFLISAPEGVHGNGHEITIRQLYHGIEIGRLTYRFNNPREIAGRTDKSRASASQSRAPRIDSANN